MINTPSQDLSRRGTPLASVLFLSDEVDKNKECTIARQQHSAHDKKSDIKK